MPQGTASNLHVQIGTLTSEDWSTLSSMATIAGVLIALFGGYVALRSYKRANQLASHAHMHALFRDYLRTRFDYELGLHSLSKASQDKARDALSAEVAPLKLYVLEEMWAWVADQQSRFHDSPWARRWIPGVHAQYAALEAWKKTILSHICDDETEVITNLEWATDCYSLGFLEFLATRMTSKKKRQFCHLYLHQRRGERAGRREPFKTSSTTEAAERAPHS